ncbi:acyl carrier protein [Streptomyces sp. HNM0663]|uniref:Acyl carrier protein n=1 Tax=Streptomyces chengmaiensis TaxID=3040919 RepID=A0ABT6HH20_9ACTN|nr:acyl carrier protein [Streptomyces chengmaiensis]MDH2388057.1 acyl carrier protein [Streptomyces chengmaiensis]
MRTDTDTVADSVNDAFTVGGSRTDAPGRAKPGHTARELESWLTERAAFHLHRTPRDVDPGTPLADYGLDSVAALSICGEIEQHLMLPVAPTIVYDFPTVRAISAHLAERLGGTAHDAGTPS